MENHKVFVVSYHTKVMEDFKHIENVKNKKELYRKYRKTVEELIGKLIPYELSLDPTTYWDLIISAEKKEVKKRKFTVIKIEEIKFSQNSLVIPVSIIKHAFGEVVDLLPSEKAGYIDEVLFLPTENGVIKNGDILGIVKICGSVPLDDGKLLELIKKWGESLRNWEDKMGEIIEKSEWPYW